MRSLIKTLVTFLLLAFISNVMYGASASDPAVKKVLLEGGGTSSDAAAFMEDQYADRREKYSIPADMDYMAAQELIYEKSNGGPIMDQLGINIMALAKNPYSQTLHFIVSLLVIMWAFMAAANPNGKGRPNGKSPDFHIFLSNFSIKVVVGIIVMGNPGMIYATAMTLKNSASMMVSYAFKEYNDWGDSDDSYLAKVQGVSDETLASFMAMEKGIRDATDSRLKAILGDSGVFRHKNYNYSAPSASADPLTYSDLENYTLAYMGLLGTAHNSLYRGQSKTNLSWEGTVETPKNLSREAKINLIVAEFSNTLLIASLLPKNGSDVTMSLPTQIFYQKAADGSPIYVQSDTPKTVSANFRQALNEVYEFRQELLDGYAEGPGRNWYGTKKTAEEDFMESAQSFRDVLITKYYAKVYDTTVQFIDESLCAYLKETPHLVYVSGKLDEIGNSKANVDRPEERMSLRLQFMLFLRSIVQKILIFIGFILFEGVIEISILLLWLAYPLWFYQPTSQAFLGRAKNIYIVCVVTAVFVFLLAVVDAVVVHVNYLLAGGLTADSGLSGGLEQAGLSAIHISVTTGIVVSHLVGSCLCLFIAPKITGAIFKGTSIVGTLAGAAVTAGMVGASVATSTALGGAGAVGGKALAGKAIKRFGERKVMGAGRSGIASSLRPAAPRGNGIISKSVINPAGISTGAKQKAEAPKTGKPKTEAQKNGSPQNETPTQFAHFQSVKKDIVKTSKVAGKEIGAALGSGGDPAAYFRMRKGQQGNPPSAEDELDSI